MLSAPAAWAISAPAITGITGYHTVASDVANFTVNGTGFQTGLTATVFCPTGGSITSSGSQIQPVTSTSFQLTIPFDGSQCGVNAVAWGIQVTNPDGGVSSIVKVVLGGSAASVASAEIDTLNTTSATQRVDTYSVELKARIQGGAFLFDQTYQVPFGDPSVQNGVTQARAALTGAGAKSFTGPTQLSSAQSLVSSVINTLQTGSQTNQIVIGSKVFVGPQNLNTGNFGICQSYVLDSGNYPLLTGCTATGDLWILPPGDVDVDTRAVSLVTVSQTATTTNTFLTTQVYELDGFPQTTPPTTPAPSSLLLILTSLIGASLYLARGKFRSATHRT